MIGSKLTHTTRVWIALGVTTCVMLVVFAMASCYGGMQHGRMGIAAAGVACGVCWVSGMIGLSAMLLFRAPEQVVQGLMLGMLFRMGLPLAASLAIHKSHRDLQQAGVIGMLVAAYLVGLSIETLMSWWIVESSSGVSAPNAAKVS